MREQIRVRVEKDGTVTFAVEGAVGSRCLSLTKQFEMEIGKVLAQRMTGDFHKSARVWDRILMRHRTPAA